MRVPFLALASALSACCASAASGATPPSVFRLDDLRHVVNVSSPQVSPDGKAVAIIVSRPNFAEDRNEAELYVVDAATGANRALTVDRRQVSEPRWSPDGKWISFLAPDSGAQIQVWSLPMQGGDARRLTRSKTGVVHYAWRPDGGAIAFAAEDEAPKLEGEARFVGTVQIGDQDMFLRTQQRPQHIWIKELAGGDARRLTSGPWTLDFVLPPSSPPSHLSWSPDGKSIAFARVPAPMSGRLDSTSVRVVNVASGKIRSLTGAERHQGHPVYSPDGKWIAYGFPRDGRDDLHYLREVYVAPASGGEGRSLTRAIDRNLFTAQWVEGGKSILVAGSDSLTTGLWIQPLDGPARRIDLGDLVVSGAFGYEFSAAPGGALYFIASTADRPSELYAMDSPGGRPRRITDFNAWVKDFNLGRMERLTWKGSDGVSGDGVLVYPPDFSPSKKYPLVLNIHGGPTSSSKLSFNSLAQAMASEGWIVYMPNYRGSDNLGNAFQCAIGKDWGRGPGRDVMAGVDELSHRPYVDGNRKAVTGWSYGGYMTVWLEGHYPGEWKCAMAGAPVTNWIDMYDVGDHNVALAGDFGGSPWTDGRDTLYMAESPANSLGRIRTPTRVMSLMEDFRVPPTQAFALYRSLKDRGVETDFIGFRGRGHSPPDPVNGRERSRLWIEWVKQHLQPAAIP